MNKTKRAIHATVDDGAKDVIQGTATQKLAKEESVEFTQYSRQTSTARTDDPLLQSLLSLCSLLHTPQTADSLVSSLPLVDDRLTLDLFPRAAQRAGLSAGLIKRPLNKISNHVLPAVLILNNDQACVLINRSGDNLTIVIPESRIGEKVICIESLQKEYSGAAFFVQPLHQFDERTGNSVTPKVKHWFRDVIVKSWPIYSEVLIASVLINLFAVASPLFTMNVYDRVVPNNAVETLWVLAIGIASVFLFDLLMKILRGYFIDSAGKKADIILSSTIFEKVMGIRMEGRPASVGAFANNLQEFETFRSFITSTTITTLVDLPFLFLFVAVIWLIGGELAYVPLTILPLAIFAALIVQKPLKDATTETFKYSAEKGAMLIESLSCLENLKSLGAEGQMQRRWEQNIGHIARLGLKSRFYSSFATSVSSFLQQASSVAVVIWGVYIIADGDLTMGGLIACTILTGRALAPITPLASLFTRYHHAKNAFGLINNLMALPVEREAGKKYLHRTEWQGNIEFKNITFNYPDQPVNALKDVSFKIREGERVAILGRIGSGKSTIEKLMMGLYQAQEGSILIDGTDLGQIDPSALRRKIGYIPQDITLVFGSLKDNITLGARHVDDEAILIAAEIAGVTEFANKHPAGFDMPVGERGAALSGGQRQSVALARAILLDPPVYILDEPSNAMDNRTETNFIKRFANHLQKQTLIIVTHKSSILRLVNRLLVLDNGNIIADGPKGQVIESLNQGKIKVST